MAHHHSLLFYLYSKFKQLCIIIVFLIIFNVLSIETYIETELFIFHYILMIICEQYFDDAIEMLIGLCCAV